MQVVIQAFAKPQDAQGAGNQNQTGGQTVADIQQDQPSCPWRIQRQAELARSSTRGSNSSRKLRVCRLASRAWDMAVFASARGEQQP